MELFVDRGDSMGMCAREGEEKEEIVCEDASQTGILYPAQERKFRGKYAPCGFDQTFSKSLMHGSSPCGAMGKRKKETPKRAPRRGAIQVPKKIRR